MNAGKNYHQYDECDHPAPAGESSTLSIVKLFNLQTQQPRSIAADYLEELDMQPLATAFRTHVSGFFGTSYSKGVKVLSFESRQK